MHVVATIGALLGLLALGVFVYLGRELRWARRVTSGDRYFALPLAERRALRAEMRRRGRPVAVLLSLLRRVLPFPEPVTRERGVTFPGMACPRWSVRRALAYAPDTADVFVATQMKCGTTWMQQIVYETLSRGRGDLSDAGHRHLYAASPWLEASFSVPLERAPRVGDPPRRVIKTHLPAVLCPFSTEARYVYVARHPVACFASCVDFVRFLGGPMAPSRARLLDWFCGDDMWWGAWPDHVEGWWRRAAEHPNVLFLHYEEMLEDLPGAVGRVASHLAVELAPEEREAVVHKGGYDFMKRHEEVFEMSPPGLLDDQTGSFFVSGRADRGGAVAPDERRRIERFVRERLRGASYPLARFYPDVAGA